jgi:hypothetical protein
VGRGVHQITLERELCIPPAELPLLLHTILCPYASGIEAGDVVWRCTCPEGD